MKAKRQLSSPYYLSYNPDLVSLAKQMRRKMTKAEQRLWFEYLSNFPFTVLKQRPIDQYIVDFYCPALRLVIEIDGDSHFKEGQSEIMDIKRTKRLEELGLRMLRFTNNEVFHELDGVIARIEQEVEDHIN